MSEQRAALIRHGYDPDARPSHLSSPEGSRMTWHGEGDVLLRFHVCTLDGIEIDGHEGFRREGYCVHCHQPVRSQR